MMDKKPFEDKQFRSIMKRIHALVTAVINKHFGSSIGQPAQDPLHTIVGKAKHSLTSCILKYYGKSDCSGLNEPLHTLTSKERMRFAFSQRGVVPEVPCPMLEVYLRMVYFHKNKKNYLKFE